MSALFGPGGEATSLYRYALHRDLLGAEWAFEPPRRTCLFIACNPSVAGSTVDDPSLRKMMHFGRQGGFSDLQLGNIFAWRATDPRELSTSEDPVGDLNDATLKTLAGQADRIVCAWGTGSTVRAGRFSRRVAAVRELLADRELWALRLTINGQPEHPLYLPNATVPFLWQPARRR